MRRNLWLIREGTLSPDLPIGGTAEKEDLVLPKEGDENISPLSVPEQSGAEEKPAGDE